MVLYFLIFIYLLILSQESPLFVHPAPYQLNQLVNFCFQLESILFVKEQVALGLFQAVLQASQCSSPVEGAVLIPRPPGAPRLSHMVIVAEENQLTRGRSLKDLHELKAPPGFAEPRLRLTSQLSTGPVVLSILVTASLSPSPQPGPLAKEHTSVQSGTQRV